MFIAHLPAGYLLTEFLQRKLKTTKYLWVGLIASIFPDIDLLFFYFIDNRQTLHHHYWTHLPLFWFSVWAALVIASFALKHRALRVIATIIFANTLLHLLLDTFVGGINWLYPFIDYDLFLITVPATHAFWVWSFVFHWSFLVELIIFAAAIALYFSRKKVKA